MSETDVHEKIAAMVTTSNRNPQLNYKPKNIDKKIYSIIRRYDHNICE